MSSSLSANDIEAVRQLMKLVSENGLSELSITLREGLSVTIKSELIEVANQPPQLVSAIHEAYALQPGAAYKGVQQPLLAATQASAPVQKGTAIASPATGIFYYSPAPGDPPFVKVGDSVKVGQVIGLLEAMKVFSDVHADHAGKVTEISAGDGALVRDGDPLIFVQ